MKNNLFVNTSPHLHRKESVSKIMWMVVLSLVPSGIAAAYIFGLSALRVITLGVISAVVSEMFLQLAAKRKVTILDGSAVLTGLLLAYNLPAHVPFWLPIAGSVFAIAIGKQIFGGLGQNIFNPALVGRVFLMASWPKYMVAFTQPMNYDAITSATPLAILKEGRALEKIPYLNLFLGNRGGCIGEVCILALLIGAAFLLIKGYISWHIPASYILTVGLFTYIFGAKALFSGDWLFHILSGGLILGAFFMATDYVTSPLTAKGQVVFGIGCGLITAIIRLWGGYPEGVSYAILMMNAATPIIDRYTKNRVYGAK
ncbi:MAG: Na+-transporting NADH:ubiquinone oxidoreductase subunit D [Candidatus Omnitrophica bacterium CG08_land_8_20_14_0_20_41_16]|uniref:Ion-translocating oxidoreductase complex subunit D n=1 Tax=Candidatus Sherwoodlollariibacterium unditelluris TaxID=1974757 RepID=A0A2G9YIK9_9BACT|nr:MAG: Na+-transporting NADH:ubiquinone oxidoreductase subunit D [Candidatus Omnitrophica bacterium CG23_combo_of_CG06-09_8_20_14_all_41_10]PIS33385.1 MAG: Na+-transporting NADH:ubiquinone oxidoreductase subunit D [Candidatus Omnitrophica bacterium CG08_land_8_20_14_0_20_41_16]